MNSQTYQSLMTESAVHKGATRAPQSPPFNPLSWVQVIQRPDPDLEELEAEQALSAAAREGSSYLRGE